MRLVCSPHLPSARPLPAPLAHAIALVLLAGCAAAGASTPEPVEFDPAFLPGNHAGQIDIARFNQGNVVLAGRYSAAVYRNGEWVGQQELVFDNVEGHASAQLCLQRSQLRSFGIDIDNLAAKAADAGQPAPPPLPEGPLCAPLGEYVPGASVLFEAGENRLEVQVPQIYLLRRMRGYVAPEQWDAGVNAGFVRYSASQYVNRAQGRNSNSSYVGIHAGLNLGGWNFRHNGSWSRASGIAAQYQTGSTYVQRDIPRLQSQLVAGEIHTAGDLFDSVRLRGASLYTDDRMLPDSMTGYAPVVRGIAQTHARVSVRQRGMLLDEVSVAPGPFVLEDLYPTGAGGDLQVTVTEADGRQFQFLVPFASSAKLLRPGYHRYALSAGRLDEVGLLHAPNLLQATWQHGLNNTVTGYTGAVLADDYRSQLLGAAFNTPVGAVSLDVATSQAHFAGDQRMRGHSVQVRYNKQFASTGTNFALGAYRYSTSGFLTAIEAARVRSLALQGQPLDNVQRVRDRMDISLSQNIGQGSVFLSGTSQNYWNRRSGNLGYSAGYSGHWRRMHYTASVQRSRDLLSDREETRFDVTASIPLGQTARAPSLTTSLSQENGRYGARAGVGGSLGERGQYGYSASASHRQGGGSSFNGDVNYRGSSADLSAGYSHSRGYRTASLSATGGLVLHPGGLTRAAEVGDTVGVVHVPDGEGTRLNGRAGSRVGKSGYVVVPHLTPYRNNVVELDPSAASLDLELKAASQHVAPRAGAVVMLDFETSSGLAMLIDVLHGDGTPLPFGADVFDAEGANVGVVGQAGKVFARVEQPSGELNVRWGRAGQGCRIVYALQAEQGGKGSDLRQFSATCEPLQPALVVLPAAPATEAGSTASP